MQRNIYFWNSHSKTYLPERLSGLQSFEDLLCDQTLLRKWYIHNNSHQGKVLLCLGRVKIYEEQGKNHNEDVVQVWNTKNSE